MGRSRKRTESSNGQNAEWAEAFKEAASAFKATADSHKVGYVVIGMIVLMLSGYALSVSPLGRDLRLKDEPLITLSPKNTDFVKPVTEAEAEVVVNKHIDAWRNKDFSGRISHLSQDFTSTNYDVCNGNQSDSHIPYGNPEDLQAYKEQALENIRNPDNITVDKLSRFEHGVDQGGISVAYRQRYEQSKYESLGTNKCHLRRNRNNEIEIYKEIFYRENCTGEDCKRKC